MSHAEGSVQDADISNHTDRHDETGLDPTELLSLVQRTIEAKLDAAVPPSSREEPTLRYKGNTKQLQFNADIKDIVKKAKRQLQPDQMSVIALLDQVGKKLDHRNKLIRLADRSGWDAVEEYEGDQIASDSEDEKKIRSAEDRARRKKARQTPPFRGGPMGRRFFSGARASPNFQPRLSLPQLFPQGCLIPAFFRGFHGHLPSQLRMDPQPPAKRLKLLPVKGGAKGPVISVGNMTTGLSTARSAKSRPVPAPLESLVASVVLTRARPASLASLAGQLPQFLLQSRATSTARQYSSAFARFQQWALVHCVGFLPAQSDHVALYLVHLSSRGASYSVLRAAWSSVTWVHQIGLKLRGSVSTCKSVLEASKRAVSTAPARKPPLPLSAVQAVCERAAQSEDPSELRSAAMVALGYHDFLRSAELLAIQRNHIQPSDDSASVLLLSSRQTSIGSCRQD